jgi:hypothetical protein
MIYFGAESNDANVERVWDILADCGTTACNMMENFVFINIPGWTKFKLTCCCGSNLPAFLSNNTVFVRMNLIRDYLSDLYDKRDPTMAYDILESLPRNQLEAYHNENRHNEWTIPHPDEVKSKATTMAM